MADLPRVIGRMEDVDGVPVIFSVNLDGTVRIRAEDQYGRPPNVACADLDQEKCEEFARLFVAACWQAGQNARRMAEETPSTPVTGTSRKLGREWCRVRPGVQARLLSFGGANEDAFAWVDVREHPDG